MVIFLMRMDNSHTAEKVVTSQFKSYEVMKLNLRSQEFQEYSLKSGSAIEHTWPTNSYESRSTGGSQNKGAHAQ